MKPDFLNKRKKIAFVAPSFGCTTEPYKTRLINSTKVLTEAGYDITLGKNCYKALGVAGSNTPKKRAKEFMDAWKGDYDAIFSVGGGETMVEILEYINFNTLKKYKPKWFMGYSDNTNLTYTITINTDIETIYGPHAPSFELLEYDSKDALDMLNGKTHFESYGLWQYEEIKGKIGYNLDRKTRMIPYNYTKPFSGIMLGGCLDCLHNLLGTKADKTIAYLKRHKDEKIIFYLEACDLTSIGIRRALFALKNAGWFKTVSGFIIGRSFLYDDNSFDYTPNEAYIDMLKELDVPIILDCDLGHRGPALPIRNGAKAQVSLNDNKLIIDYE